MKMVFGDASGSREGFQLVLSHSSWWVGRSVLLGEKPFRREGGRKKEKGKVRTGRYLKLFLETLTLPLSQGLTCPMSVAVAYGSRVVRYGRSPVASKCDSCISVYEWMDMG